MVRQFRQYFIAPSTAGDVFIMTALALLCAVLYLPDLDANTLYNEEPRRALIAKTMMQSGDFIVPRLAGEIYLAKPPLFNWLIAAFSAFNGEITAFSARLPSVLSLAVLCLFVFALSRPWLSQGGRVFAAVAILFSPELMSKGVLGEIEMVFTLLVTASIWLWFHAWVAGRRGIRLWLPALVVVALAMLAKGPPALIFFYLSVLPWLIVRREFSTLMSGAHAAAFGVMMIIFGLWITAIANAVGWDALWKIFEKEMLRRGTATDLSAIIEHALAYPIKLWLAIFPFSLALLLFAHRSVRDRVTPTQWQVLAFALLATGINLVVYLTREAAVRYFLPMLPTLIIASAICFDAACARHPGSPGWFYRAASLVAAGALGAYTLAVGANLIGYEWTTQWPLGVSVLIIALGAAAWLGTWQIDGAKFPRHAVRIVAWFLLAGILTRLIHIDLVLAAKAQRRQLTGEPSKIVAEIAAAVDNVGRPLTVRGFIPYEILFYADDGLLQLQSQASDAAVGELRYQWPHSNFAAPSKQLIMHTAIPYAMADNEGVLLVHIRKSAQ